MDGVRNGAKRQSQDGVSVERANETASAVSSVFGMFQSPTANGFFLSQKLALEGARFWARRMRAYADQMEVLARCTSPDQVAAAHGQFFERMQDDYAQETAAVSEIVIMPKAERGEGERVGA
jgi:hypothetical protein